MKTVIIALCLVLLASPAFAVGDGGLVGPLGPVGQPTPQPVCHSVFVPGQGYSWVCE